MARIRKDAPDQPGEPARSPPPKEAFRVSQLGAAEYDEEMPSLGSAGQVEAKYPTVDPQPCHYMVFAPERWGVIEGHVVPMLYRLPLSHGVNGVDGGPGQAPRLGAAREMIEAKGHTVLPWDIDGRTYLRSYQIGEAVDPKTKAPIKLKTWHSRWETLYPGSDRIETDTKGYAAWLSRLIESGKLPYPRAHVLGRLESEYSKFLASCSKKWGADSDQAQAYRRDLTAIRDMIEKLFSGPLSEPAEPSDDDPAAELGTE